MTIPEITRSALKAKIENNDRVVLLEALGAGYFSSGHLPGALNLPHTQVRQLAPSLLPDKSAEIVVYCASATCQNSHLAAAVLDTLGYPHVSIYKGGKQDWQEAGLPLER